MKRTLQLSVDNTGFLLDRLGADCAPLQFLRELTQNSIDAILKTPEKKGDILWDVDWTPFENGDYTAHYKLSITDNGVGMSPEEMVQYINQLSSSGSAQSLSGNFGVGAKIAAATKNHAGMLYLSWQNGVGHMIHLWRDPKSGQYGLKHIERPDGTYEYAPELDNAIKPSLIKKHGTKVILLGMHGNESTTMPPEEAASPSKWVSRYLNTRYFKIPNGVTIKAREGLENKVVDHETTRCRTVMGMMQYLDEHAESTGEVKLQGAKATWWILKDGLSIKDNASFIESAGHIGALYHDELYEVSSGRSGYT